MHLQSIFFCLPFHSVFTCTYSVPSFKQHSFMWSILFESDEDAYYKTPLLCSSAKNLVLLSQNNFWIAEFEKVTQHECVRLVFEGMTIAVESHQDALPGVYDIVISQGSLLCQRKDYQLAMFVSINVTQMRIKQSHCLPYKNHKNQVKRDDICWDRRSWLTWMFSICQGGLLGPREVVTFNTIGRRGYSKGNLEGIMDR